MSIEAQLDAIFSVLLGVLIYRDLKPNATPIEHQLFALQTIGKEINDAIGFAQF